MGPLRTTTIKEISAKQPDLQTLDGEELLELLLQARSSLRGRPNEIQIWKARNRRRGHYHIGACIRTLALLC